MTGTKLTRRLLAWGAAVAAVVWVSASAGAANEDSGPAKKKYRAQLGPDSKKIKTEGDKTLLWAGGDPDSPDAEWYDFTGSPISAAELQFGIGKDRIRAIDDPLFVSPDDPRLLKLPVSRYRRGERPATTDDVMVIGYVQDGDARAYPTALLDRHEVVNDRFGGKPVAVGW